MANLAPLRTASRGLPAIVMAADQDARERFLEFFASNIRNPHTRRTYLTAVEDFLDWCEQAGVGSFRAVRSLHVAAWVEQQSQTHKAPIANCSSLPSATCSTGWSTARWYRSISRRPCAAPPTWGARARPRC
jgi:hypothetical protein